MYRYNKRATMEKLIKDAIRNPLEFALTRPEKTIERLLRHSNEIYRNKETEVFSDLVYDTIKETFEKRFPTNKFLTEIGAPIGSDNKVPLKYHMGSMNKFKTLTPIKNFVKTYPGSYVISDKLDGNSALLLYNNNTISLFSRGDGKMGQDISHLVPFINGIPKNISKNIPSESFELRGELIVSKEKFKQFDKMYAYPRSMVNAVINSKHIDKSIVTATDFVAFELITPHLSTQDQFKTLKSNGFIIPTLTNATHQEILDYSSLEESFLNKTLKAHKEKSNYSIDGIIVTLDGLNEKNVDGNPKYSFAFKVNEEGVNTKVTNIVYNVSKHGKLIPTITFEPIKLGNSTVKNTTGFSASYIENNNLNVGSEIKMVLSGDVIPYIVEVIKESPEGPLFPDYEYIWDKNHVHIFIAEPELLTDYNAKRIVSFMKTLKIENVSIGIVRKLIEAGYDTIKKILLMVPDDFKKLPGFKDTLADKIYTNIHIVTGKPVAIELLMDASLTFSSSSSNQGFSIKRFKAITNKYSNLTKREPLTLEEVKSIPGFSDITANQFVSNYPKFLEFLKDHYPLLQPRIIRIVKIRIKKKIPNYTGTEVEIIPKLLPFINKKVVLTGFREDPIIEFITENGGEIMNTVNSKTSMLVVKDNEYTNSKIEKAQELNIPIMTKDEFISKYL